MLLIQNGNGTYGSEDLYTRPMISYCMELKCMQICLTELRPATPDRLHNRIARTSRSSHRLQLHHPPPV